MALVALLDASVLWSAAIRDTLLSAVEADLYRPAWTREILDQMARSLKARRPHLEPSSINRTVDMILSSFPEALVEGYEDLIPLMTNNEGDRHVLAAAVRSGCAMIVTWNKDHFPMEACEPYGIEVQDPDDFLCDLWAQSPGAMADVVREQAGRLVNPHQTVEQLLETLSRSVPNFAQLVLSQLSG